MLWFYLQRDDSGRLKKSEKQLCEEFLNRKFVKNSTKKKLFIQSETGNYLPSQRQPPYPGLHTNPTCSRVIKAIGTQPTATMREIFQQLELDMEFSVINKVRLLLTTNSFPFLVASIEETS